MRAVASRVLSLCSTPFGSPVVPEVKGRYDLIGVAARPGLEPRAGQIGERRSVDRPGTPETADEIAAGEFGENVMPVGIGAVTGLREQCRGMHAVDQRSDVADRVVAMQGRTADITVARA